MIFSVVGLNFAARQRYKNSETLITENDKRISSRLAFSSGNFTVLFKTKASTTQPANMKDPIY